MILGQLRLQFTSILCQWENVCYLLAFSSCFSPKLNSFFITNTESAFQIYLVLLEQGHSPQTAEKCTTGFSCCIVAEPWLCSIRCCTPTPSLFRAKLSAPLGIFIFSQTVLVVPTQQAGCALEKELWGFFPFSFPNFSCKGACWCSCMMKTAWAPKNCLLSCLHSSCHFCESWDSSTEDAPAQHLPAGATGRWQWQIPE